MKYKVVTKFYSTDDSLSIPVIQLLFSGVGGWWMVVVTSKKMLKKWAGFTVPPLLLCIAQVIFALPPKFRSSSRIFG